MINVQYLDMPCRIHGMVRENGDDSYTIILNSRDTRERNLQTYIHELDHLLHGDLEKADAQAVETDAHKREV